MNAQSTPPYRPASPPAGHHHDQIVVPRQAVYLIIGFVALALVLTIAARLTGIGTSRESDFRPVAEVSFIPQGTGNIGDDPVPALIARKSDGTTIQLAGVGQEIFPRLILRGFVTLRKRAGIDPALPIELEISPDGQRLLRDSATGKLIRLSAFGGENGHAFDALLPARVAEAAR